MKIYINFGFILILMTIALVMIMSLGSKPYPESTSLGILIGMLIVCGIIMLKQGFTYDTKKRRFTEW